MEISSLELSIDHEEEAASVNLLELLPNVNASNSPLFEPDAERTIKKPHAEVKKLKREIKAILGHWDGASPDKPRVLTEPKLPRAKCIPVCIMEGFNGSGGYLDRFKRHHQEFPPPVGKTVNGIRQDSPLFNTRDMYRWFWVQFIDVDKPRLGNWSHWTRYDTMYDCFDLIAYYYSDCPKDYTLDYEEKVREEEELDKLQAS